MVLAKGRHLHLSSFQVPLVLAVIPTQPPLAPAKLSKLDNMELNLQYVTEEPPLFRFSDRHGGHVHQNPEGCDNAEKASLRSTDTIHHSMHRTEVSRGCPGATRSELTLRRNI